MAITTSVRFVYAVSAEDHSKINDQIAILVADGVTDGTKTLPDGPVTTGRGIRTWTTLEAANNWITFINGVQNVPALEAIVIQ